MANLDSNNLLSSTSPVDHSDLPSSSTFSSTPEGRDDLCIVEKRSREEPSASLIASLLEETEQEEPLSKRIKIDDIDSISDAAVSSENGEHYRSSLPFDLEFPIAAASSTAAEVSSADFSTMFCDSSSKNDGGKSMLNDSNTADDPIGSMQFDTNPNSSNNNHEDGCIAKSESEVPLNDSKQNTVEKDDDEETDEIVRTIDDEAEKDSKIKTDITGDIILTETGTTKPKRKKAKNLKPNGKDKNTKLSPKDADKGKAKGKVSNKKKKKKKEKEKDKGENDNDDEIENNDKDEEDDDEDEDDREESDDTDTDNIESTSKDKKNGTKTSKKKKNRAANMRKNIREILSTNELEEETLAAQREEAERRKRVEAKLQQQKEQNLVQMLLKKQQYQPHLHHYNSQFNLPKEGIGSIFPGNGLNFKSTTAGSPSPRVLPKSSTGVGVVVDEVTLSSDDEDQVKIEDPSSGLEVLNKLQSLNSTNNFLSSGDINIPFRSSGGTVTTTTTKSGKTNHDENDDVISLSSDNDKDSDSSDDCVVISPPSFHDDIDKEGKEDEANVPDELGRVLVNVQHPPEDPDIFLAPQIARAVKPHQIGGIRFLYDNVIESLELFNTSNGFGCILAHSMGLGKTIQAVSFCDIFLRHTRPKATVLIIVPINTIQNWLNEFNHWLPPEDSEQDNATKLLAAKNEKKQGQMKRKPKVEVKNENIPEEQQSLFAASQSSNDVPSPLPTTQSQFQTSVQSEEEKISTSSSPPRTTTNETNLTSLTLSNDNGDSNVNMDSNTIDATNSATTTGSPMSSTPSSTSFPPSSSEDFRRRNFQVFVLNEMVKTLQGREKIIEEWNAKGGVLLLGYEMYRMLALKRLKRSTKKKSENAMDELGMKSRMMEELALERIYSHIVKPGPDLVICDEGHRIKNSGASISQALKAIRTKRRIVLTGYPLQNNLMEYWCMVDFVRPNYLGSKVEFSNMFERPISNGQCVDSSSSDKKLMRYRSHVLHTLLEGFVQRRSHLVLQSALPFKEEWVFFLKMTSIQYALYKEFIRYLKEEKQEKEREKYSGERTDGEKTASTNPIKAFAIAMKIWNHSDIAHTTWLATTQQRNCSKHILDDLDLDDIANDAEDPLKPKKSGVRRPRKNGNKSGHVTGNEGEKFPSQAQNISSSVLDNTPIDFNHFNSDLLGLNFPSMSNIPTVVGQKQQSNVSSSSQLNVNIPQQNSSSSILTNNSNNRITNNSVSDGRSISLEWATPIFKDYEAEVLENGVKFQLLFAIIEEVLKIGDKLLVFSQSLLTLDLIEFFLKKKFSWKKHNEYFRLDGSTSGLDREKLIFEFNDKLDVHVFLVSTRAGSLGINLIGANRVVVFDASWNPCHDAQAVCRVYRYGQKKECQIYRFVTDCSLEKRIYDRQVSKRGMSDRVVDEMNPETHLNTKDVCSFLVLDHKQMDEMQSVKHNFDMNKFSDPVLKNVLDKLGDRLTKEPVEHESLLIDRKDTKLSASEKRIAHRNYQFEKNQSGTQPAGFGGSYVYNRPSYAAFYPQQPVDQSAGIPLHSTASNFPHNPNNLYNSYPTSPSTGPFRSNLRSSRPFDDQMMELKNIQQRRLNIQQQERQQQQQYQQDFHSQPRKSLYNSNNFPFQALKERGIDVQSMLVKKDAYLRDPTGPEIYLRAGEKIHIFRSKAGLYLRVANGRIISVKQLNPSLLPKGTTNAFGGIAENLTEEQIQAIVFSLLRPAGKTLPPYYNSYMNPSDGITSITHQNSNSNSSDVQGFYNHKSKPLPNLQKLPATPGLLPPSYPNHSLNRQISTTNFKSNSGGDVTIWRKDSSSSSSDPVSGGINRPHHHKSSRQQHHPNPFLSRKMDSSLSSSSSSLLSNKLSTPSSLIDKRNNSNNKDADVEVIEFDEHFGEVLQQNQQKSTSLNLNMLPSSSSSSPSSSSSSSTQLQTQQPDMSIMSIVPSNSNNIGKSVPLTLDSLLGNDSSNSRNFTLNSKPLPTNFPSIFNQSKNKNHRNSSSVSRLENESTLSWDHNSCSSGSDQGSNSNHNFPGSNTVTTAGSADDNLESLFWSLTGESPRENTSNSSKNQQQRVESSSRSNHNLQSSTANAHQRQTISSSLSMRNIRLNNTSTDDDMKDADCLGTWANPNSSNNRSNNSTKNYRPHDLAPKVKSNNSSNDTNLKNTPQSQNTFGSRNTTTSSNSYANISEFNPDALVQNMFRGLSGPVKVNSNNSNIHSNSRNGTNILSSHKNSPLPNTTTNSHFPFAGATNEELFGNFFDEAIMTPSGTSVDFNDFLGARNLSRENHGSIRGSTFPLTDINAGISSPLSSFSTNPSGSMSHNNNNNSSATCQFTPTNNLNQPFPPNLFNYPN